MTFRQRIVPHPVLTTVALSLLLTLPACRGTSSVRGPAATRIGGQKQLFIEDSIVAEAHAISRVLNHPQKHAAGPVITATTPWEGNFVTVGAGTVIYDDEDKIWKIWYNARKITAERPPRPVEEYENALRACKYKEEGDFTCYATSRDGLHWDKPALGQVEFNGSKNNNIMFIPRRMRKVYSVYKDPHEQDPARRYKIMGFWFRDPEKGTDPGDYGNGTNILYSSDGIHATAASENSVTHLAGDVNPSLFGWDGRIQKYIAYFRLGGDKAPAAGYERLSPPAGRGRVRSIAYSETNDFVNWSPLEHALTPDSRDPVDLQFYGMPVVKYESYYLGFPWLFRTNPLTMESGFAYSHDGKDFSRPDDRCAFIPLGTNGTWDDRCIYMQQPVLHDDVLWFYYDGVNWAHSAVDLLRLGDKASGAIGLATLPLDGFVSLEAGPNEGTITTKPLVFKGNRLIVNFEASLKGSALVDAGSSLTVELLDETGNPWTGFGREQAVPVSRTGVRQQISWQSGAGLANAAGKPVRVRFHVRNGKLYSFQFVD